MAIRVLLWIREKTAVFHLLHKCIYVHAVVPDLGIFSKPVFTNHA